MIPRLSRAAAPAVARCCCRCRHALAACQAGGVAEVEQQSFRCLDGVVRTRWTGSSAENKSSSSSSQAQQAASGQQQERPRSLLSPADLWRCSHVGSSIRYASSSAAGAAPALGAAAAADVAEEAEEAGLVSPVRLDSRTTSSRSSSSPNQRPLQRQHQHQQQQAAASHGMIPPPTTPPIRRRQAQFSSRLAAAAQRLEAQEEAQHSGGGGSSSSSSSGSSSISGSSSSSTSASSNSSSERSHSSTRRSKRHVFSQSSSSSMDIAQAISSSSNSNSSTSTTNFSGAIRSSPSSSSSSSMLAAATERLEAAPSQVTSPLQALVGSVVGSHTTHALPPFNADQEQREMLAKATSVVDKLRARHYSAFIVGGWVRDVYLQRRPADIDIATSASPSRVKSAFKGDPMVDLPRSTVKLTHQGEAFELSFFKGISRTSSLFSVGMDAVCRDFTVNALYYDPHTNEVLDFVGGVDDALSRTLRLTHDDTKRLTEDPLRVLRGVRFATVLGLKLAPGTALAMKRYAHMCSPSAGVPPRRIWLELRKLCKAEAQQPGAWPHALKLSYHLGLLSHMFPWLQQQQQQQRGHGANNSGSSRAGGVLDPFGHGVSTVGSDSSSSSSGGVGGSSEGSSTSVSVGGSSAAKAVLVAERLSKLWRQQQQQQQRQQRPTVDDAGVGEGFIIPLPLLVAATVHPSVEAYAHAEPHLRQLFPDPQEYDSIHTLMTAARLVKGAAAINTHSTNTTPNNNNTQCSNNGSVEAGGGGGAAADAAVWAQLYSHRHAAQCFMVLSCWMPEALAGGFLRQHMARLAAAAAK